MKAGPVNDSPHALPICTVLTIAAAGSEMGCGGVISSMEANEKLGLVHPLLQPKVFPGSHQSFYRQLLSDGLRQCRYPFPLRRA